MIMKEATQVRHQAAEVLLSLSRETDPQHRSELVLELAELHSRYNALTADGLEFS